MTCSNLRCIAQSEAATGPTGEIRSSRTSVPTMLSIHNSVNAEVRLPRIPRLRLSVGGADASGSGRAIGWSMRCAHDDPARRLVGRMGRYLAGAAGSQPAERRSPRPGAGLRLLPRRRRNARQPTSTHRVPLPVPHGVVRPARRGLTEGARGSPRPRGRAGAGAVGLLVGFGLGRHVLFGVLFGVIASGTAWPVLVFGVR